MLKSQVTLVKICSTRTIQTACLRKFEKLTPRATPKFCDLEFLSNFSQALGTRPSAELLNNSPPPYAFEGPVLWRYVICEMRSARSPILGNPDRARLQENPTRGKLHRL